MRLSVIIPAYNEEASLGLLLERVLSTDLSSLNLEKELIVVDDGSTDSTAEVAKEFPSVILIRHKHKCGKGKAIRTGLKHCTGEFVLIQDADLEYDPQDYSKLLKPLLFNGAQVVYGSRFLKGSFRKGMRLPYYIANKIGTALTNFLYGSRLTDEATGYKVFSKKLLKEIHLESDGFEFCPEITAKVLKRGVRIAEVPINYISRKRSEGKKFFPKDCLIILKTLIKYKLKD
jgi:glycosyltransferase involved in cell wall biosynthesis